MIIKNGCVTLRAIEVRDAELLLGMMNSPEIERAIGGFSLPVNEAQQREWIDKYRNTEKQIRWMIELDNGCTIGVIMLFDIDMKNGTAEVGYKTMAEKDVRIKGDMDDAMQGVLGYAFGELRLNCVYAHALVTNERSERMLERNGFSKEGVLRQRTFQNGSYVDMNVFSILGNEFDTKAR
ncbi:MAG: GNAT family N-acetyltransferase [Lachnospiraceae bacterium]|nr:GNAT family N-acetyltransferase [Lachnospiraceae bacterium]